MIKRQLKGQYLQVKDLKINYYTFGQGRPLLFIHGHRADALRWKGMIKFAAQFFKVYAPDLPGCGKTQLLNTWHSLDLYTNYLESFVKKLNLKKFDILGPSLGGVLAIKLAQRIPQKINRLILFAPPFHHRYFIYTKQPKIREIVSLIKIAARSKILTFLWEKMLEQKKLIYFLTWHWQPPEYRKKNIVQFETEQWYKMKGRVWLQTAYELLSTDLSHEKPITIPALIIFPKADHYLDVKNSLRGLKKILPKSKAVIVDLPRHVPPGELPPEYFKKFQPQLEKFFKNQ
jgi:pimeloyl-ACP methyl ester carboxylesterase